MKPKVFISYSREDKEFIAPIVKFIRALRGNLVFQDIQDILAGKPWEDQLNEALDNAKLVVVFWCSHSAKSEFVKKEYERAILENKDVLPVLLDNTPVEESLARYQWVDFREFLIHTETSTEMNRTNDISKTIFYSVPGLRNAHRFDAFAYLITAQIDKKFKHGDGLKQNE